MMHLFPLDPLMFNPYPACTEEVKNSLFGAYCSSLVCGGFFKSVAHEHLTVGHTHTDVGYLVEEICCYKIWLSH